MRFFFLFFIFPFFVSAQKHSNEPEFNYKNFRNLHNYFESKEQVKKFFDFKKGDVIADVGAGEAYYLGAFSLLYDSLHLYAEDINPELLNQKRLNKVRSNYEKVKGGAITNTFQMNIGAEKSSGLPDDTFDKIYMLSVVHEFTYMDEMLQDLKRKLKKDGRIYIIDGSCTMKGHRNYSAEEINTKMTAQGFTQLSLEKKERNQWKFYLMVYTK